MPASSNLDTTADPRKPVAPSTVTVNPDISSLQAIDGAQSKPDPAWSSKSPLIRPMMTQRRWSNPGHSDSDDQLAYVSRLAHGVISLPCLLEGVDAVDHGS